MSDTHFKFHSVHQYFDITHIKQRLFLNYFVLVIPLSLSMGISEEIEDAKITAEKTKISKLKRRSENYPKFA